MSDTPRTDAAVALTSQHRYDDCFGDPKFGWVTAAFARELERENAALRKDKERLEVERCECLRTMDLALNSNAGLREVNAALKNALDHQMTYQRELRADRDRLDWLMTQRHIRYPFAPHDDGEALRERIDAAMLEGKQ